MTQNDNSAQHAIVFLEKKEHDILVLQSVTVNITDKIHLYISQW